jgi:hypothetical protein
MVRLKFASYVSVVGLKLASYSSFPRKRESREGTRLDPRLRGGDDLRTQDPGGMHSIRYTTSS